MNAADRRTYRLGGLVLLLITGAAVTLNVTVLRDPELAGALLLSGAIAVTLLVVGIFRKDAQ